MNADQPRTGSILQADSQTGNGEAVEPLVIFPRDAELGMDPQGYMILGSSGQSAPRVGERIFWAEPQGYANEDPGVKLLREKCGVGPIVAIGGADRAYRTR